MKPALPIAVAIVLGAMLIAAAIAFTNRWAIATSAGTSPLRLDRWTGAVWTCASNSDAFEKAMNTYTGFELRCTPATPAELKAAKPRPEIP